MAQGATAARWRPGVAGRGQSVSDRIGQAAVREGIDLPPVSNGFTSSANNLIAIPEIQTAQRQAAGQTARGLRLGIVSLRSIQSEMLLKPRRARRARSPPSRRNADMQDKSSITSPRTPIRGILHQCEGFSPITSHFSLLDARCGGKRRNS